MHPDIAWFSQFSQRNGKIPGRFRIPFCHQLDWILRFFFSYDWRKKEGKLKRLLVPRPGEANRIWEYIIPEKESIPPHESRKRLHQIFHEERRKWEKSFIIAKLPRFSKHINILTLSYPAAKFIHIIRDGRAVALSVHNKFLRNGETARERLIKSSSYWVEIVNYICMYKENANILDIQYEDFCNDVKGNIEKILSYIDLKPDIFPFHKIPETLTSSNPKWLERVSDAEIEILEEIQGEYLKKYGYIMS